jgi:hypothetical protein
MPPPVIPTCCGVATMTASARPFVVRGLCGHCVGKSIAVLPAASKTSHNSCTTLGSPLVSPDLRVVMDRSIGATAVSPSAAAWR